MPKIRKQIGKRTAAETAMEREKSAYMLAWREKMIEKYKEMLKCAQEENQILSAYLRYLLLTRSDCGGEIKIPKEEVARLISGRGFTARETDGFYIIKENNETSEEL